MARNPVRRWGVGALLAGAGVMTTAFGTGVAHADSGTDQINGWTVTPGSGGLLSNDDTLSDPSNSLGLGSSPITGNWISGPAAPLSSIGSDDQFATLDAVGTSNNLYIQDTWLPGIEEATVQVHNSEVVAFLVPGAGGNQIVDLFTFATPAAG